LSASDARGLALSTGSDLAAEHYRYGVDLLLAAWPGAAEALDQAVAADPGFALAHAARGRLHAVRSELAQARACLAMATELVLLNGTARERSHVEILALLAHGEPGEALRQILSHLDDWPADALILSLPLGAFGLFAFSGMADHDQARVDLCNRHSRSYGAQDWWFLSARGWAEAENGDVVLGRAMLQRAFALRPENANAVHGWAHALYEAGAPAEADALLTHWLPIYDRRGLLHGHLAWHMALLALEAGDADRALDIYASQIAPAASAGLPINVVSDGASLLWRLDADGAEHTSAAWADLAGYAARAFPKPGHPFVDLHMALIEASVGDAVALGRRADANLAMVEAGVSVAGPVVPALCRAVLDFAEGQGAACARRLEPVLGDVARIGGSGAQRQLVEDTYLIALMRSAQSERARELLDRRLHRRPSARDERWRQALYAPPGRPASAVEP